MYTVFTRIIPQGYYSNRRVKTGALFEAGALFEVDYYFQCFFFKLSEIKKYLMKFSKIMKNTQSFQQINKQELIIKLLVEF